MVSRQFVNAERRVEFLQHFVHFRSHPRELAKFKGIAKVPRQNGQQISITCQVRSASMINGTSIWDRLSNGSYITDYYTTTPAFNNFSPGLPHC